MSKTVSLLLSPQTRQALCEIVDDRRHAVKHVLRARIVLLWGEGLSVQEVARQAGVSRPLVWRWQQHFAEEGLDGLLHDKTRLPGKPATPQGEVASRSPRSRLRSAWHKVVLDEILDERLPPRNHRRNKQGVKRKMSAFPVRRKPIHHSQMSS